ncbi:unnamed protein product [Menidia menidia]|uniref:(Atlantic silverside) hypothetical protein n=1 Tax=Menidia menidia TaxID=238744 RepID=A0A8S4BRE1_9TELE|nr:unnamed protein product [Menidia menidia]
MDLSSLPTSASENNKQRTGTRFTVRSANSPSYSLTRRSGIRKRENGDSVVENERQGTPVGTNGAYREEDPVTGYQARTRSSYVKDQSEDRNARGYQPPTTLNQNGTAERNITGSAWDGGEIPELMRCNLPGRSRSLNSAARSQTQSTRADMTALSFKRSAVHSENAGNLEEKSARVEFDLTGGVPTALHGRRYAGEGCFQERSPVNHTNQTFERSNWGRSLPSRFRSDSLPTSKSTENLFGSSGGRSIKERIEELYGSASDKVAGRTFPRRLSSGNCSSPAENTISQIWAAKNSAGSEAAFTPGSNPSGEEPPARQLQSRYTEAGDWGKGMVESGTRSLDRARSRFTLAAQIRSDRTAGGLTSSFKQNTFPEDTHKDSFGYRKSVTGSKEDIKADQRAEMGDVGVLKGMLRESTERVPRQERETDERAKQQTEFKIGSNNENVFDSSPQKIAQKNGEDKKCPEKLSGRTATSVRNKISQFEALTQRAGSQVSLPRRTYSVPGELTREHDGLKKSLSAKEICGRRHKWEGPTQGGGEEMEVGKGKTFGKERSSSVDEVGLGLVMAEKGGVDSNKNNFSEDFEKYRTLKSSLHIPLNKEAQTCSRKIHVDETDFSKRSSPKELSGREVAANIVPSPHPSSLQPTQRHERNSPASDDDKTPTNSPQDSPFISPAHPGNTTLISGHKTTPLVPNADKTEAPDPPPLVSSSLCSLSDNVNFDAQKGKKSLRDLEAWVAGLIPEFDSFKMDAYDYEDDDDESTQRDEDSNYDSDSGESSVTITSNMSQSDRRSYSVSLSDLCNFTGADYESDNDPDEWPPSGRRSVSLSSDVSGFSCVSLLPTEELDRLVEDVKTLGDDALEDYSNVQVVVLHKEEGVGLGFSLAGGADQNKPITVHKVFPSGVAAQEGSTREGDRVLSINGTALCGSAHWEALRVLRRAKTRKMGVVVLRRGDVIGALKSEVQENDEGQTQTQQETGQRVCVQLEKKNRDLGFSLQGGVASCEGNRPLTVQKIFQGGPVDKVCPGDELLEIQGISMTQKRRLEAWTFIKHLPPGPVEVVLRRPIKHLQT